MRTVATWSAAGLFAGALACGAGTLGGAATMTPAWRDVLFGPTADVDTRGSTLEQGSESLDCLGCHDGVIGPEINLLASHPIGVTYTLGVGYKPSPRLPLYDGRVECPTCHDVDPVTLHWTATRLSMARSALCLECHDK